MLAIENKKSVIVVAGVGQSGKSTFAIRYLLNAPLDLRFVWDCEGEYSQRLNMAPACSGYDLALGVSRGWILFDPDFLFPGRRSEALAFFCEWAFEVASARPGRKVLVIDEVWKHCSPAALPPELALVCQTGRKRGLGLLVNTQLPNKLNGSLLNECSEFVAFRLQYDRALEVAAGRGFDPQELQALPDLHFVSRTENGSQVRGAIEL